MSLHYSTITSQIVVSSDTKLLSQTKKVCTLGGARTHDHKIKSLALYHLSYEGVLVKISVSVATPH